MKPELMELEASEVEMEVKLVSLINILEATLEQVEVEQAVFSMEEAAVLVVAGELVEVEE